jgi:hypothetical protein
MIGDHGAFGGMIIGRGNRSTRRITASVPLYLPKIPHDLGTKPDRRGRKPVIIAWPCPVVSVILVVKEGHLLETFHLGCSSGLIFTNFFLSDIL